MGSGSRGISMPQRALQAGVVICAARSAGEAVAIAVARVRGARAPPAKAARAPPAKAAIARIRKGDSEGSVGKGWGSGRHTGLETQHDP